MDAVTEAIVDSVTLEVLIFAGVALAFAAVATFAFSVQSALGDRRRVNRTIRSMRTSELEGSGEIRRRELAPPVTERVLLPAMRRLAKVGRRFTPVSVVERLEQELQHAGSPPAWDASRVLAFKVLTPAVLSVVAILLVPLAGLTAGQTIIAVVVAALVGWYAPEWVLRSVSQKRQQKIQRALPDSLDLLSITVQAGLGFDAALSRVAREIGGPLGEEFYRVVQELQLGAERVVALRGLADRNSIPELKSFVLAMIQAQILGVSVGDVLQVQAGEMRLKRRQRAEEQAMKLPVKIVFPLIFCIFPALFVVLLGPAAIQISETVLQVF